ncbi:MAG: 4-alpha-glucanotransferase [Bryobacteraceae bacterium]
MSTAHLTFTSSENYDQALDRAARLWGIQPDYWDIWGNHHTTAHDVKQGILASLGVDPTSRESLDGAAEERIWQDWGRPLPPALVISENLQPAELEVSIPAEYAEGSLHYELRWEDARPSVSEVALAGRPATATAEMRGRRFVRKRIPLPSPLRLGYHDLAVSVGGQESVCRLIITPDRAWRPAPLDNGGKAAGVTVSLYGLRSERNWGCGDCTDLHRLADWVAEDMGGSFIGLNPLHAIHNRTPYNTSPYLPNCTYYRNFLYIDVERVEDFRRTPKALALMSSHKFQQELAAMRAAEFVDYEKVSRTKLRFLKLLFRTFLRDEYRKNTRRAQEFHDWCEREGELLHLFAVSSALDEVMHKRDRNVWLWTQWPAEYHDPYSEATRAFAERHWRLVLAYKYIQWQLDSQLAEAHRYARGKGLSIGLYHDLALATDRFGSDLWAHRPYYVAGCRVGSPPDSFAPEGQDWSFPPPNSEYHRLHGYRLFAESIRKNCRHGGALRIDHVMRFFRLFWIPDGHPAARGTYVHDNYHDLIRILALESVRSQVLVIGEDLGTVEPYIREELARFGILSYRLFYFEKHPDGRFRHPGEYPEQAFVSSTTHDLPTLAGYWIGRDIEARRQAGLLDEAGYHAQRAEREGEKQKMLDLLFETGFMPPEFPRTVRDYPELTGELHNAVVGFLASTPSMLMGINQEDLTKELDQQNLPGSTAQYPNWRRKMRYRVEELRTQQAPRDFTGMFRHWLEKTGRLDTARKSAPTSSD